ncbi:MAG: flagellar hook-length control protein FliK [Candidatus Caenarcaniphilales bacterium]|jgi:hypothetical protein|nr:flagellar hook-length control protein FliK [Candidatus Caenarcaniphilales bacterium]
MIPSFDSFGPSLDALAAYLGLSPSQMLGPNLESLNTTVQNIGTAENDLEEGDLDFQDLLANMETVETPVYAQESFTKTDFDFNKINAQISNSEKEDEEIPLEQLLMMTNQIMNQVVEHTDYSQTANLNKESMMIDSAGMAAVNVLEIDPESYDIYADFELSITQTLINAATGEINGSNTASQASVTSQAINAANQLENKTETEAINYDSEPTKITVESKPAKTPELNLGQKLDIISKEAPATIKIDIKELNIKPAKALEIAVQVLEESKEQLNAASEKLSADIVKLDINRGDSIDKILANSDKIELIDKAVKNLEQNLDKLNNDLQVFKNQNQQIQSAKELEPEQKFLIETKIQNYVEQLKAPERLTNKNNASEINANLDAIDLDAKSIVVKDYSQNNSSDSNKPKDRSLSNMEQILLDLYEEEEAMDSNQEFKTFIEQINHKDLGNHIHSKLTIIKQPVAIERFAETVNDIVQKQAPSTKQELRLSLNPEHLGQVELDIVKNGNKIEINIEVTNLDAYEEVKEMVKDIESSLRHKDFEASVRVSVNDTNNTENNRDHQKQESATEEEQKRRNQNNAQNFFRSKNSTIDFISTLEERLWME